MLDTFLGTLSVPVLIIMFSFSVVLAGIIIYFWGERFLKDIFRSCAMSLTVICNINDYSTYFAWYSILKSTLYIALLTWLIMPILNFIGIVPLSLYYWLISYSLVLPVNVALDYLLKKHKKAITS